MRQVERTEQQKKFCGKLADIIDRFCQEKLGDLGRATMLLALGRYQQSPFSPEDLGELRRSWFDLLPDKEKAQQVPEGQPFFLHGLAQSLRLMGDPDTEIIDGGVFSSFAEGVHIGHVHPIGPLRRSFGRR